MRRGLAVALLLSPLFVHAPAAAAYVPLGYVWPGTTIHYWVAAPEDKRAIKYAARAWNAADVGIRFRRARSAEHADFVVERGDAVCGGSAWAGYYGPGVQTGVRIGTGCHDRRLTALVATHELGHVLGLDHEPRICALMNKTFDRSGTPSRCHHHRVAFWYARPLRSDDIRGARSRYPVLDVGLSLRVRTASAAPTVG